MAAESRSFKLGRAVTVTAPDAVPEKVPEKVAESVAAVVDQVFGRRGGGSGRARRTASADRLSTDRIVDVAIDQMRAHGYDAVTMRSIARELDTGPASLYAHVANRAELDQLVVGRVCSQWEIPEPDAGHWDRQLRESMIALLGLYRANPGVARCTLGMVPLDPGLLTVTERLLALLKTGGVSDRHAAWFVDVGSLFVASVAVEEDIWLERDRHQQSSPADATTVVAAVRDVFDRLPPDHFPWLSSLAGALTSGSGDDRFAFGIDLLIGGLKSLDGQAS